MMNCYSALDLPISKRLIHALGANCLLIVLCFNTLQSYHIYDTLLKFVHFDVGLAELAWADDHFE